MNVLDLFSGIGGFSLGLERAGMTTVAFCERDGYARRVLRKHWPHVWLYEDVATLTAKRLRQDGLPRIDLVCGGFPCQDISSAGKGAGIDGARSGLWSEMLRVVEETRPRWVVAENVPALRSRGADRLLADLEGAGYAVRPVVVGAWAVGGKHQRQRAWIVGNARRVRPREYHSLSAVEVEGRDVGDMLQDPGASDRDSFRSPWPSEVQAAGRSHAASLLSRRSDGIPFRVDRIRCLGNAVVPLIPELIGRWVLRAEAAAHAYAPGPAPSTL